MNLHPFTIRERKISRKILESFRQRIDNVSLSGWMNNHWNLNAMNLRWACWGKGLGKSFNRKTRGKSGTVEISREWKIEEERKLIVARNLFANIFYLSWKQIRQQEEINSTKLRFTLLSVSSSYYTRLVILCLSIPSKLNAKTNTIPLNFPPFYYSTHSGGKNELNYVVENHRGITDLFKIYWL